MFAAAIIVFREVLEAALIIGIVAASTRNLPGRNYWLGVGMAAGLGGSVLVAGFAGAIAELAEGMGQECSQTHGLRRTTVGGGVNACQGSSEFVQSLPAGAAGRQRDGAGANHHDLVDLPLTRHNHGGDGGGLRADPGGIGGVFHIAPGKDRAR